MNDKLKISSERLFFTSDTHFHHALMLKHRTFTSVEAMNDIMIETWNKTVNKKDTVIHLGDFSFGTPEKALAILVQLNEIKHLVKGNHDHTKFLKVYTDHFVTVNNLLRIATDRHLVCSHYPMLVWDRSHYGSWHLHGHCHGSLEAPLTIRLDVGWAVWHRPLHYSEIAAILETRELVPCDHHGVTHESSKQKH